MFESVSNVRPTSFAGQSPRAMPPSSTYGNNAMAANPYTYTPPASQGFAGYAGAATDPLWNSAYAQGPNGMGMGNNAFLGVGASSYSPVLSTPSLSSGMSLTAAGSSSSLNTSSGSGSGYSYSPHHSPRSLSSGSSFSRSPSASPNFAGRQISGVVPSGYTHAMKMPGPGPLMGDFAQAAMYPPGYY